ncbi:hypothetical protein NY08_2808 [Rhodococcus sp. B7740]|nr:hypothetical protein NY08_2808 [Rhodococcus sp. B7740]
MHIVVGTTCVATVAALRRFVSQASAPFVDSSRNMIICRT